MHPEMLSELSSIDQVDRRASGRRCVGSAAWAYAGLWQKERLVPVLALVNVLTPHHCVSELLSILIRIDG